MFAGLGVDQGRAQSDYYHPGQRFLDAFTEIYAPTQAVRIDAIRARPRSRRVPPFSRDQLLRELGD